MHRLIDATLVGPERATPLQHEGDILEGRAADAAMGA